MSKEKEWEQVDPKDAIRVEIVLENDNMDIAYHYYDENLSLLAERLFAKERSSIMKALKIHEFANMQEVANGNKVH